jgi:hypothetical protein
MALRRRQSPFEVVDVGYDLNAETEAEVNTLAKSDPAGWDIKIRDRLFRPPATAADDLERRLIFGSDFPYRRPDALTATLENCKTELSHGAGGFGNVWGAAMLPYTQLSLRSWPIAVADLERSYRNVLKYVPLSAESDELCTTFPLHTECATPVERSPQADSLLAALDQRKKSLRKNGIEFGRARTAVNSAIGAAATCRYCGHCLDGCVYGSIFNPRQLWRRIDTNKSLMHPDFYVLEFEERDDRVHVLTINTRDGSLKEWSARRLFLAAGHFATTRIVARSLRRLNEPIRISDSQYFYFPFLSYRAYPGEMRFALADVFLEILNETISQSRMHFQVYGMNKLFKGALRSLIPSPLPIAPLTGRLLVFQGYLPSSVSGHLEMSLLAAKPDGDEVRIRGFENPEALRVARKSKGLLGKSLRSFGLVPPLYLKMVPLGRSFHAGGSFPMGGKHQVYSSDTLGRPAGLKRVHIVDSANFPDIASSTIGFTIMANADRIAEACAKLEC